MLFSILVILLTSTLPEKPSPYGPIWHHMKDGDSLSIKTFTWGCLASNRVEMNIFQDEAGLVISISKNSKPSHALLKKISFKSQIFDYLQHIGFQSCVGDGSDGYTIVRYNQNPPDTISGCPRSALF